MALRSLTGQFTLVKPSLVQQEQQFTGKTGQGARKLRVRSQASLFPSYYSDNHDNSPSLADLDKPLVEGGNHHEPPTTIRLIKVFDSSLTPNASDNHDLPEEASVKTEGFASDDPGLPKYYYLATSVLAAEKLAIDTNDRVALRAPPDLALALVHLSIAMKSGDIHHIWHHDICARAKDGPQHSSITSSGEALIFEQAFKKFIWLGPVTDREKTLYGFIRAWSAHLDYWKEAGSPEPGRRLLRNFYEKVAAAWPEEDAAAGLAALTTTNEDALLLDLGAGDAAGWGHGGVAVQPDQTPTPEPSPGDTMMEHFKLHPYWQEGRAELACRPMDILFIVSSETFVRLDHVGQVFLWVVENRETLLEWSPHDATPEVRQKVAGLVSAIIELPLLDSILEEV